MFDNFRLDTKLILPEETLQQCLMRSGGEIKEAMQRGVERAVYEADSQIEDLACEAAKQAIRNAIDTYFTSGEGWKAIRSDVFKHLAKTFAEEPNQ